MADRSSSVQLSCPLWLSPTFLLSWKIEQHFPRRGRMASTELQASCWRIFWSDYHTSVGLHWDTQALLLLDVCNNTNIFSNISPNLRPILRDSLLALQLPPNRPSLHDLDHVPLPGPCSGWISCGTRVVPLPHLCRSTRSCRLRQRPLDERGWLPDLA